MKGPRFLEPNGVSVAQAALNASEKHRRERQARQSMRHVRLPPSIQADADAY